jgi:L-threonylcarbamoyladenylate synthase
MPTELLTSNAQTPDMAVIQRAAALIKQGGLVAFPTETVYGLGANGLDPIAVRKIFAAKQRPSTDPVILHVEHWSQFSSVADLRGVESVVAKLAAAFMPGALTLVLPKLACVPPEVTASGPSVAVRVPNHAVALALLAACGTPIAAPSANLFSRPSPTTAQMVLDDLDGRIDVVLDGGATVIGVESTILNLCGPPTLLRPGGVALEAIEAVIGEVLLPNEAVLSEEQAQPAPGMLLKHYSPRAKLLLLADDSALEEVAQQYQHQHQHPHPHQKSSLGLLLPSASMARLASFNATRFDLGPTAETVAARLFKGMRELDQAGCTHILTQQLPVQGLGRAINDRLFRAAEGCVIGRDSR